MSESIYENFKSNKASWQTVKLEKENFILFYPFITAVSLFFLTLVNLGSSHKNTAEYQFEITFYRRKKNNFHSFFVDGLFLTPN